MTFLQELTDNELLRSIWAALRRLEERLADPLVNVAAPVVNVEPPNLEEIVTAVLSLNGTGPTAEDIARAIAESLHFPTPEPDESLARVADALERVSNQLKGLSGGTARGGGGSVSIQAAANSNVSVVPAVAGLVSILGANPARKGVMIHNLSNGSIYVKFGPGASGVSYSFIMDPDSYYEMPGVPVFTGPLTGHWVGPELEALEGEALVTELS